MGSTTGTLFTSAQKNAGFAYIDLLFNSVVLFRLDKHLLLPLNKSIQRFPKKQIREPCELLRNECFQKDNPLYGMYINFCKILNISFSSDLPVNSGPDRFTVPLNPKIPLIRSTSLLLKVRSPVPFPKTAMNRSPVPNPEPAMITMNPMITKINMNRSPGPKPDMISMILMKPTNIMKTTYEDESISICHQKQEKIIKSKKPKKNIKSQKPKNISRNPTSIQKTFKNNIENHTCKNNISMEKNIDKQVMSSIDISNIDNIVQSWRYAMCVKCSVSCKGSSLYDLFISSNACKEKNHVVPMRASVLKGYFRICSRVY